MQRGRAKRLTHKALLPTTSPSSLGRYEQAERAFEKGGGSETTRCGRYVIPFVLSLSCTTTTLSLAPQSS